MSKLRKIYFYFVRPILLFLFAAFLVDWLFGRNEDLNTKLIRSIVFGLILGLAWFIRDSYFPKKKDASPENEN